MKIVAVETPRIAERPNLVWVRLRTDEGITGLGESWFGSAPVEADVHTRIAPLLLGADPGCIDALRVCELITTPTATAPERALRRCGDPQNRLRSPATRAILCTPAPCRARPGTVSLRRAINSQTLSRRLRPYVGFFGSGAEMRACSAVDVALWDIERGRAGDHPRLLLRLVS